MKFRRYIIVLMILICILIFSVSIYVILKDFNELNKNNKAIEDLIENTIEINEDTHEKEIDWGSLKSINDDIVGWIEIDETDNISYPILKDKNLYYLNHSFNKEYNSNGSIFTTSLIPFDDNETVIHGHNEMNNIKLLDFNEKINYYKKMSRFQLNNNYDINKVVKLSTCSYINTKTRPTDQRLYVIANLIEK